MNVEITKILWATDGSDESEEALKYVNLLVEKFGSEVVCLSVVDVNGFERLELSEDIRQELLEFRNRLKEREAQRIKERIANISLFKEKYSARVETGEPHEVIVKVAEDESASMIALGKRSLPLKDRIVLGSTTNRVLRSSRVPVLAVRRAVEVAPKFEKILVPTDFSELEEPALNYALELARAFNAKIYFLHVAAFHHSFEVTSPHLVDIILEQTRRQLANKIDSLDKTLVGSVSIVPHCLFSLRVWIGIVEFAAEEGIDLIVMSTHGRKGISHMFLGSVAEKVISEAPCPVIAIKPSLKVD